jgi:hypothetical protein
MYKKDLIHLLHELIFSNGYFTLTSIIFYPTIGSSRILPEDLKGLVLYIVKIA